MAFTAAQERNDPTRSATRKRRNATGDVPCGEPERKNIQGDDLRNCIFSLCNLLGRLRTEMAGESYQGSAGHAKRLQLGNFIRRASGPTGCQIPLGKLRRSFAVLPRASGIGDDSIVLRTPFPENHPIALRSIGVFRNADL